MRPWLRRALAGSVAVAALLLVPAGTAAAHPLGNFTVNLYSGLAVVPGEIRIDYVVDLAEIPALQELGWIDTGGDGAGDAGELEAWAAATAPRLAGNLELRIDGELVELSVRRASARYRPGQGGLPTLRFEGVFVAPIGKEGWITYEDANFPGRIGWREITAVGERGRVLEGSSVPAATVSETLLSYPQDLLSSPLDVRVASAGFRPGESVVPGAVDRPDRAASPARPGVEAGPFAGLVANRGLGLMVLGVLLAMAFGAWHALLPGHGKTLMAAAMVGSGARVRQAVGVGAAVASMHTASVLALGMLVLTLERTFRPEALYPWLGLLSGLVALGLGVHLLVGRLSAWMRGPVARPGAHSHPRGPGHDHPHGHTHGDRNGDAHGRPLSRGGLTALALAGGILPAPSALLVMLASIGAHRVAYGLGLVLAFSVGLATALIVVGVGALRMRDAAARRLTSPLGRLVPVVSAAAIVAVGGFLTVRGAMQV